MSFTIFRARSWLVSCSPPIGLCCVILTVAIRRGGLEASIKLLTRWVTVSDDVLQVCSLQKVLTQLSSYPYIYVALVCIIKHSGVPLHAFRSQTADNLIRVSFVHVMHGRI